MMSRSWALAGTPFARPLKGNEHYRARYLNLVWGAMADAAMALIPVRRNVSAEAEQRKGKLMMPVLPPPHPVLRSHITMESLLYVTNLLSGRSASSDLVRTTVYELFRKTTVYLVAWFV